MTRRKGGEGGQGVEGRWGGGAIQQRTLVQSYSGVCMCLLQVEVSQRRCERLQRRCCPALRPPLKEQCPARGLCSTPDVLTPHAEMQQRTVLTALLLCAPAPPAGGAKLVELREARNAMDVCARFRAAVDVEQARTG